jgi:hypothetical protein
MAHNNHQQKLSGKGRISFIDDEAVGCDCMFTFTQRADGTITVECEFSPEDFQYLQTEVSKRPEDQSAFWFGNSLHKFLTFKGQTESGSYLEISDVYYIAPSNWPKLKLVFHAQQAKVEHPVSSSTAYWVFRLLNYEMHILDGSEIVLENGARLTGKFVPLHFNNIRAWPRAIDGQAELIKQLKAEGGFAVTAEFILPATNIPTEEKANNIAISLRYVLTLLSGNSVTWFSYSSFDSEHRVVSTHFQNTIASSFQGTDLLQTLSEGRKAGSVIDSGYAPIINRMMERFAIQAESWNLFNIINVWHEANIMRPLWEQQNANLLANCMEMLRQRYVQHIGQEYILPDDEFTAKKNKLAKEVKKLLIENFPCKENWTVDQCKDHRTQLSQMSSQIKSLNRPTFQSVIVKMAQELNVFSQWVIDEISREQGVRKVTSWPRLDAREEEVEKSREPQALKELERSIEAFVKIRDQLTHQGSFLDMSGDVESNTDDLASERHQEQLWFMQRFVGAFLSTILGWHQPLPSPPTDIRNPYKS